MTSTLNPEAAGTRSRARELLSSLPDDLSDSELIVDLSGVRVATSSFLDELLMIAVVDRGATSVRFLSVPLLAANAIDESAADRGIEDRVSVDRRGER